jgi:uncharacterized alpha-E superfamily protein
MLSRIAESLYWMNRYVERTDGMLRIIHTNYVLSLDKGGYGFNSWKPVLQIFSACDADKLQTLEHTTQDTLYYLLADVTNHNSIRSIITKSRENARGAQDHITKEVWEQINHIYHHVNKAATEKMLMGSDSPEVLDQLIENAILYNGVSDSTMPRNMGWSFMTIGKFVERCLITLEVANKHFLESGYSLEAGQDILYWRNLLLSLSGYELYLKTNKGSNHNLNIANQVLFGKQFTRSVIYCLEVVGFYLKKVIDENKPEGAERLLKIFGRVQSRVEFTDVDMVNETGLQKFLHEVKQELLQFNRSFEQIFFSYA